MDKFSISIGFGKLISGKTYNISTLDNNSGFKPGGSGKATLTESGNTKTVTIKGKTKDGVGISAIIVYHQVMTPGGIK